MGLVVVMVFCLWSLVFFLVVVVVMQVGGCPCLQQVMGDVARTPTLDEIHPHSPPSTHKPDLQLGPRQLPIHTHVYLPTYTSFPLIHSFFHSLILN